MREVARALDIAVGDEQAADVVAFEVPGEQLDGHAGTDQQCRMPGKIREKLLRETHGRICHRHRAGADFGVGPDLLGDGKRVLEQPAELFADRAALLCLAIGVLELAQDLRLTEHHRVEPAGDPKDVPDRVVLLHRENRLRKRRVEVSFVVQPVVEPALAAVVAHYVKLGTVTGGQQHRLVHAFDVADPGQRPADLLPREDDLLANFHTRRVMVQPEYSERHIQWLTLCRPGT